MRSWAGRWWSRAGEGAAPAVLIAVAFGVLCAWNLGAGGYAPYYAWAARSMSQNWHAFVYGAMDRGAHVTLDKLSGFLVPQAVAARIFGFHPWSIALPQVGEGVVTVLAVFVAGRRWRGARVGLVAAAMVASTPLLGSMFARTMEDGLLTMSLALALVCWQSSVSTGRLRPLLFCALWVAIGFQAKMMQAWIILPALVVGYLVCTPWDLRARLRRTAALLATAAVLSVSWMAFIQLTPAADRPYIDATTNDNVFSMVFGYNGINRIFPGAVPGTIGVLPAGGTSIEAARHGGAARMVLAAARTATRHATYLPTHGIGKLLYPAYTTQVGWLFPLALAGTGYCLVRDRRTGGRASLSGAQRYATTVAVTAWLALAAGLLSVAAVPHPAYLAAICVQVSLLAAAGTVSAFDAFRARTPNATPAVVGAVLAESLWSLWVAVGSGVDPLWLPIALGALAVAALAAIARAARARGGTTLVWAALLAVVLAGQLAWSGWLLSAAHSGTAGDSYAGPRPPGQALVLSGSRAQLAVANRRPFTVAAPFSGSSDPTLTRAQRRFLTFVARGSRGHQPAFAVDEWLTAVPYVLAAGADVVPVGGFSGRIATTSTAALSALVRSGRLRFVLLTTSPPAGAAPGLLALRAHVRASCTLVAPHRYEGTAKAFARTDVYDCATRRR